MNANELREKLKDIMPPELMTFFNPLEGMSATEANFLAERIKEVKTLYDSDLDNTADAKESLNLGSENIELKNPLKVDFVEWAKTVGKLHSLSAWLREGVKAKDRLLRLLEQIGDEYFLSPPELIEEPPIPEMDNIPTEDFGHEEALSTLSVADRSKYLSLEAQAAVIGKLIHEDGKLFKVKNKTLNFDPVRFMPKNLGGTVSDLIVTRTPLYDKEELTKEFFELHTLHRELEKELNAFRAKLHNIENEETARCDREYREAYEEAYDRFTEERKEREKIIAENFRKESLYQSKASEIKHDLKRMFSSYKIILPHALESVAILVNEFTGDTKNLMG